MKNYRVYLKEGYNIEGNVLMHRNNGVIIDEKYFIPYWNIKFILRDFKQERF